MKSALSVVATFVFLAAAAAFAQPQWVRTGTVDASVAGDDVTLYTFVAQVADGVAEGIEDDAARAVAEQVAGTEQHTATWMMTDPVVAGELTIMPATMFVMISARVDGDPYADAEAIEVDFALDPTTLELRPEMEIRLAYQPRPRDQAPSYVTTDATVVLDAVEAVDERTLAVRGTVSGVLRPEDGAGEALSVEATIDIDRVVGSTVLQDLLGE